MYKAFISALITMSLQAIFTQCTTRPLLSAPAVIQVHVRDDEGIYKVEVSPNATIADVRKKLSETWYKCVGRLTFGSKVRKENAKLADIGVGNGAYLGTKGTIIIVKKTFIVEVYVSGECGHDLMETYNYRTRVSPSIKEEIARNFRVEGGGRVEVEIEDGDVVKVYWSVPEVIWRDFKAPAGFTRVENRDE